MTTEQQLVQAMKKTLPKDVINHIKGFVKVKKTYKLEVSTSDFFYHKLTLSRDDDDYVLDPSDFAKPFNCGKLITNIRTESWADFKSIVAQQIWNLCEYCREHPREEHPDENRVDVNLDFYIKTAKGHHHLRELYMPIGDCSYECTCKRTSMIRDKLARLLENYRPYLHMHYF